MRSLNLNTDHLRPFTVGFDEILDRLTDDAIPNRSTGFPPYNIRKESDVDFKIDLAVAGLGMEDIDIEAVEGQLIVRSVFDDSEKLPGDYIHRGISQKKFTRSFMLADDIEVNSANLKNGLLTINLKRIIPEEKKPKKIEINLDKKTDKRFLTE